ncbi:MAG: hypothetical protein JO057_25605 [Chloroflexi bacterium]|nr:hypothetical protein [Chloroflexota bacterium]
MNQSQRIDLRRSPAGRQIRMLRRDEPGACEAAEAGSDQVPAKIDTPEAHGIGRYLRRLK